MKPIKVFMVLVGVLSLIQSAQAVESQKREVSSDGSHYLVCSADVYEIKLSYNSFDMKVNDDATIANGVGRGGQTAKFINNGYVASNNKKIEPTIFVAFVAGTRYMLDIPEGAPTNKIFKGNLAVSLSRSSTASKNIKVQCTLVNN